MKPEIVVIIALLITMIIYASFAYYGAVKTNNLEIDKAALEEQVEEMQFAITIHQNLKVAQGKLIELYELSMVALESALEQKQQALDDVIDDLNGCIEERQLQQ